MEAGRTWAMMKRRFLVINISQTYIEEFREIREC